MHPFWLDEMHKVRTSISNSYGILNPFVSDSATTLSQVLVVYLDPLMILKFQILRFDTGRARGSSINVE